MIFERVYGALLSNDGNSQKLFFIDSPGGCGKTFLLNLILRKIRSEKKIALAVATSGLAAILLDGGTTAHSHFKIPLKLDDKSYSNISNGTLEAELLKATELIV